MSDGEPAPEKHRGLKEPWKPGQSGNPAGRQKGSRNKLGEEFLSKLYADFQEHGDAVIVEVRQTKPEAYLKVVASILPQKLEIEHTDNLTDDERRNRIREIAEQLGGLAAIGLAVRADRTAEVAEAQPGPDQAISVSTLQ